MGLSHSGADLAHEIVATHPVILSGKSHGQMPFPVDSKRALLGWPVVAAFFRHVATLDTPIGRKMAPEVKKGGGPLLRWRKPELLAAGVELVEARTVGVQQGKPVLADGRVLDVANVVWCTGFSTDYSWISPSIKLDEHGWPVQYRGVSLVPGLYFMGLVFQYSFASMTSTASIRMPRTWWTGSLSGRPPGRVLRSVVAATTTPTVDWCLVSSGVRDGSTQADRSTRRTIVPLRWKHPRGGPGVMSLTRVYGDPERCFLMSRPVLLAFAPSSSSPASNAAAVKVVLGELPPFWSAGLRFVARRRLAVGADGHPAPTRAARR